MGASQALEYDVVCVGAGAGGMAAALTASIQGLSVLLIEKTPFVGGSTAISGGAVWIPDNAQGAAMGIEDSLDRAKVYMDRTVGNWVSDAMKLAFLKAGPTAIDFLQRNTHLSLTPYPYAPDYYPDVEGAALAGRCLEPDMFDGRLLGEHFKMLRDPLPVFTVLGGMMVNVLDVFNLLSATKSFASWKHSMKLIARYAKDRMRYRRGTRLLLGNALAARLFKSVLDRGIPVWVNTPAIKLVSENDRVTGLVVERAGVPVTVRARYGVVLATGGFPNDHNRRAERLPHPTGDWSMAPAGNTGDGLSLGNDIGGAICFDNASNASFAPVSIWQKPDGQTVKFPHLVWDRAKPGLMAINGAGRRFVNESTSYHDFVLAMYASNEAVPTIPAYLVCDATFLKRWGLGLALPGGRPFGHLVKAGYLIVGKTLDDLARQLAVPPTALRETVERFNAGARAGHDDEFGKGGDAYNRFLGDPTITEGNPCLGVLETAPFYAIKVYPGDIGTTAGLRADEHARVLDEAGRPIAGLYVAGNDMNSVMGGTYPAPGITLGPALTFGYLAGMNMASEAVS